MKIVSIIEYQNGNGLYSIHYSDEEDNAYHILFDQWNDVQFLSRFFEQNPDGLSYFKVNTIEEAIEITLEEVERLDDWLCNIAENEDLQLAFSPLNDGIYTLESLQPSKAKAKWLRIYAIRIDDNCYVITGGGIKMTHKMNEDELLELESHKIMRVKEFLKEQEILYPEDIKEDET